MTIQAKWHDKTFEISDKQVKSLNELSRTYKLKKKTEGDKTVIQGHKPETFSLSFEAGISAGINPLAEYRAWSASVGQSAPLILESARWGPNTLTLKKVTLDADLFANDGIILHGTISIELFERGREGKNTSAASSTYKSPIADTGPEPVKNAVLDTPLKVSYNGIDITDSISTNACEHDMYASNRADTLIFKFNDTKRLWDGWSPKNEEIIEVVDGIATTGKMFIETVTPENGLMTLRATSVPPSAKEPFEKSWENVRLLQLFEEVAQRCGLAFESHHVNDILYDYVRQENQPNFAFLQERAELESLAFVVFDKKLVLYDEAALENTTPAKTLNITERDEFTYSDDASRAYGKCSITNGAISAIYECANGLSKTLPKRVNTVISSIEEGKRFAKGLLRQENKALTNAVVKVSLLRELAAGSVINLKTPGTPNWDKAVFAHHVRQDYVNKKTKLFMRKAII